VCCVCACVSAPRVRPTCFVEGVGVRVAGRLLGRFRGVHVGSGSIQSTDTKPGTQPLRSGGRVQSSRLYLCSVIPHMLSLSLSLHPPLARCFLPGLVFQGWRRLPLLFPVQPLSLSLCWLTGSLYRPPSLSLPPPVPPLPLALSLSLSLARSLFQFNLLTKI